MNVGKAIGLSWIIVSIFFLFCFAITKTIEIVFGVVGLGFLLLVSLPFIIYIVVNNRNHIKDV